MSDLQYIQQNLHAPKKRHNSFGNYNYRSAEDILEAVKPLLNDKGLSLTLTDEAISVGEWVFIKATAALKRDTELLCETTAYARHGQKVGNMADAQVSGSCSSYARKYALNGMFLIDDSQDDDATNTHGKDGSDRNWGLLGGDSITSDQYNDLLATVEAGPHTTKQLHDLLKKRGITTGREIPVCKLDDLTAWAKGGH